MTQMQSKARVRLYACGGAGANIGNLFEAARHDTSPGFSEIDVVYVDTSRANLKHLPGINPDNVYVLKTIADNGDTVESDGSGGVRKENYGEIVKDLHGILEQFPPLQYNLIVSSCAGGSGSVFAPLLAGELLDRESIFAVLGVGDTSSLIRLRNTSNTLKSYDGVAKNKNKPILLSYLENGPDRSRDQVNAMHEMTISSMSILYSGQNAELDTRDLGNWQYFNRDGVTTFPARLVSLHILDSREELWKDLGHIVSVATVTTREIGTKLPVFTEYQKDGYLTTNIAAISEAGEPMHFATAHGPMVEIIERLETRLEKAEETQAKRKTEREVISERDVKTSTGVVL